MLRVEFARGWTLSACKQKQVKISLFWFLTARGNSVWVMCSENVIRVVLSFSFLLHINTPPCVVLGFFPSLSLCSSPADPTESRWIPHPAFCSAFNLLYPWQRALQRNAGVLSRHSFIDLYIIDTHPEGASESRLVSPVSLGEDFFLVFSDRSAHPWEPEDSVLLTVTGALGFTPVWQDNKPVTVC